MASGKTRAGAGRHAGAGHAAVKKAVRKDLWEEPEFEGTGTRHMLHYAGIMGLAAFIIVLLVLLLAK